MIKAPYNFVPISEKVVFPEWAPQISHDIPFSDGISGTISVTLTAKSPIFVRNGHSQNDGDNKTATFDSFCHVDSDPNHYFIPGSTIKGAVRNALEIMSFGKMRLDRNAQFAEREWDNPHLYTLKKKNEQDHLRCGWLRFANNRYEIVDCGEPGRIAQTRIDEYLNSHVFKDNFSKDSKSNLNKERQLNDKKYNPKTAEFKYRLVEDIASLDSLRDLWFSEDEKYKSNYNNLRLQVDYDGNTHGTIVLTGQPDLWMYPRPKKLTKGAGKFYEFVFKNPKADAQKYFLSDEEFDHYKFIYTDSPDWKYAVEKLLPTTGMPVFFRVDKKTGGIRDWGLAFLYKLPYDNTPYELLPAAHRSSQPDLSDCIFGYIGDEASLKGRVQFTPFWSHNAIKADPCTLALCGPKASYYPIYISQEGREHNGIMTAPYMTYNDGGLKGWKRYILRRNIWGDRTNLEKIDTKISPLSAGTSFDGKIIFHNLRPEELGGLLSALTFHGNEKTAFHQIGMAKPYGYGKVKVDITDIVLHSVGDSDYSFLKNYNSFMAIFETILR